MPNGRTAPIPDSRRTSHLGFVRSIGTSRAILACIGLAMAAEGASANGAREGFGGELSRWEVAVAGEFGVYARTAEASASGTLLVGPRASNVNTGANNDGPDTVIEDLEGENDVYSLVPGATFTVMTPSLDVATQPRLFLDVSILAPSTLESSIVRQGDPGKFGLPYANSNVLVINEPQVLGTGVEVSSQEQDYQLQVGLGMAFTFDVGESRIRLKPSVRYDRTQNVVSAVAKRAVRLVRIDPIIPGMDERFRSLDGYRLLTFADEQREIYHGIGAGLEVEYLTQNRLGPFELSLYLKGGATYIMGDLKTAFFSSNPEYPEETVSFKYKNDPWAYQAATGIRLRFSPKRPR